LNVDREEENLNPESEGGRGGTFCYAREGRCIRKGKAATDYSRKLAGICQRGSPWRTRPLGEKRGL